MKTRAFKSIVCVIAVLAMMVCVFAGCGEQKAEGTYKVGVLQLAEHEALSAATEGFKQALTDRLGDRVTFDTQIAGGDPATCATIANQMVSSNVDLILANATAALQASMAATAEIPIVATSITDFATALDATEWTGVSGINVTGTSDLAPLADQVAMIKELVPDVKQVGILYCSGEPNSKYQASVVASELDRLGIAYQEYTFTDSNDIAAAATLAADESDCIYIPTDNAAADAKATIDNVVAPKNIPVIAGEEGICKGCGVATLSISYYSIGYKAGEMAYEILENGADPAEMEIQFATDLTKKYVADRAATLGITVPDTYVAIDMSAE